MYRRALLKNTAVVLGWPKIAAAAATAPGTFSPFTRFKLGAISDGFSQDFEESLRIMKGYGLAWVEIRKVFGVYNTEATPAEIRQIKELLAEYGFRVSVIDSALYKCSLPGTKAVNNEKDLYAYSEQMELLHRACDRAHSLGTDKIRGFTFWRVADPESIAQRVVDELGRAAEVAKRAGMRLVIENEETCNAGTGHELSKILSMASVVNLGANWDVGNGYLQGEVSFPEGYGSLDKKRIWHMHLKGITCASGLKNCSETFAGEGQINLLGQLTQLLRDGYQETMSLECEFEAPGLTHLQTAKRSLEGLIKLMSTAITAAERV